MFTKIASGQEVSYYHSRFKSSDPFQPCLTFSKFSKVELDEENILFAITQMHRKLSPSYSIDVMLPETLNVHAQLCLQRNAPTNLLVIYYMKRTE